VTSVPELLRLCSNTSLETPPRTCAAEVRTESADQAAVRDWHCAAGLRAAGDDRSQNRKATSDTGWGRPRSRPVLDRGGTWPTGRIRSQRHAESSCASEGARG